MSFKNWDWKHTELTDLWRLNLWLDERLFLLRNMLNNWLSLSPVKPQTPTWRQRNTDTQKYQWNPAIRKMSKEIGATTEEEKSVTCQAQAALGRWGGWDDGSGHFMSAGAVAISSQACLSSSWMFLRPVYQPAQEQIRLSITLFYTN